MLSRRAISGIFALLVGLGVAWWLGGVDPSEPATESGPPPGVMTDEEREAYVAEYVRVVDLAIGPDTKPDSDEPVPGLLRVTGKVLNEGDRAVDTVVVVIYPKNELGEVMATDQQDVIVDAPLEPEEIREFHFQVRDRPGFSGAFDHVLR